MEVGGIFFLAITLLLVLGGMLEKNSKLLFLLQVIWMYILLAGNTFSIDITVNQDIFDWAQTEQFTLYDYICYIAGSYLGMKYLTMNAWLCLCIFTLLAILLWKYTTNPCFILSLLFCYPFADMVIQKRWFIASALVLVSFLFLLKGNKKGIIIFTVFVLIAAEIHAAALGYLVFLSQPLLHRLRHKRVLLAVFIGLTTVIMPYLPALLAQIPLIGEVKVAFYFEVLHEKIKYPLLNFSLWTGFHVLWVLLFRFVYFHAKKNMRQPTSKSLDIFFSHAVVYVAVWVFLFEFVSENILGLPETKDHSTISSYRFYHFIDYICLLSHGESYSFDNSKVGINRWNVVFENIVLLFCLYLYCKAYRKE